MQKKNQKGCGRKAFIEKTSAIACFCVVFLAVFCSPLLFGSPLFFGLKFGGEFFASRNSALSSSSGNWRWAAELLGTAWCIFQKSSDSKCGTTTMFGKRYICIYVYISIRTQISSVYISVHMASFT